MAASSARSTTDGPGRRTRTVGQTSGDATAVALSALSPADWVVMHEVVWPGRSRATIDHVVVGPPGVFVIDSTTRPAAADHRDADPRPVRAGAVRRAEAAADAVAALLPTVLADRVFPLLSLAEHTGPRRSQGRVVVCSPTSLTATLTGHGSVLAHDRVAVVARGLRAQLRPDGDRSPGVHRGRARGGMMARLVALTAGG